LSRQGDEPTLSSNDVSHAWHLLRCECGHSYGRISGGSGRCTRCGSSRFRIVSEYGDSRLLADAVADANMPKEIAQDIASRISEKASNAEVNQGNSRSKLLWAMYEATDEYGQLSIASLAEELAKLGIFEPTPDYLIGQAEIEGILIRHDPNSWTWLQQSS